MMTTDEFRRRAHELVDWMADYLAEVERYPVRADVQPGQILNRLPLTPPGAPEPFDAIFRDFREIVLPGMTHWQHPSFFAYFPANSSPPSILAEMLTATLGAQCMSWVTSPAATELEERMMEWLRDMIGLPSVFRGVIQDTASTSTLCSILTAREQHSQFAINSGGFDPNARYALYCSTETHYSIEKAVKIAGFGARSLRKLPVDEKFALKPEALEAAISKDRNDGLTPLCAVATLGTTGSTAIDPLKTMAEICRQHGIWLHVDAAYAGTALLLPEMRWMIDGVEGADSFVFNPHKWMLTNFDCSAFFVRDPDALISTFALLPEYMKTKEAEQVNNYRDWGIQQGRRFRALKLWFVIRSYGVQGLQDMVRSHIAYARSFAEKIRASSDFELLAPVPLAAVCFRYHPDGMNEDTLNSLNALLLETLNRTGRLYMTHTKLNGLYTLRFVSSQTGVTQRHVDDAWQLITSTARSLPHP
ncbi:MAG: aminotransferase class I/II-fold pyridoxal phosphate-dependent enzyme [Bacteroidota bacterium]